MTAGSVTLEFILKSISDIFSSCYLWCCGSYCQELLAVQFSTKWQATKTSLKKKHFFKATPHLSQSFVVIVGSRLL